MYGSDGFRRQFQDNTDSPDQARHYIGGFYAGFMVGKASKLMDLREYSLGISLFGGIYVKPQTPGQRADVALNAVSTRHGRAFLTTNPNKNGLILAVADKIRNEVCAP